MPASLPIVVIDRTIVGARCSREGAEVIAALRLRERNAAAKRLMDCDGLRLIAESNEREAVKLAADHTWWARWGPLLLMSAIAITLPAGMGLGFAVAR